MTNQPPVFVEPTHEQIVEWAEWLQETITDQIEPTNLQWVIENACLPTLNEAEREDDGAQAFAVAVYERVWRECGRNLAVTDAEQQMQRMVKQWEDGEACSPTTLEMVEGCGLGFAGTHAEQLAEVCDAMEQHGADVRTLATFLVNVAGDPIVGSGR